jgi:hypothetical protein
MTTLKSKANLRTSSNFHQRLEVIQGVVRADRLGALEVQEGLDHQIRPCRSLI